MTNATPFESARWLGGAEMRRWLGEEAKAVPAIAYLDLGPALN